MSQAAAPDRTGRDPANETFDRFRECFDRAAAAGIVERCFRVGSVPIRLRFAGEAIVPLYWPAFAPFEAPCRAEEPLEVLIWDSASTGVPAPALDWRLEEPGLDHVARYDGPEVVALQDWGRPALTLARPAEGLAIQHLPAPASVNWLDRASALRFALFALLRPRGLFLIHAAAVGRAGRAALLAGPSGAGKSTLSVACLLAGMDWAGDDYVALEMNRVPRVHAHHATAKMDAAGVERVGAEQLVAGGGEPPDFKLVLDASRAGAIAPTLQVAAVLVPRRHPGAAAFGPASASQAYAALAPTTMFQPSSRDRETAAALAALVQRVPSRSLLLGEEPAENVRAVAEALDGLG